MSIHKPPTITDMYLAILNICGENTFLQHQKCTVCRIREMAPVSSLDPAVYQPQTTEKSKVVLYNILDQEANEAGIRYTHKKYLWVDLDTEHSDLSHTGAGGNSGVTANDLEAWNRAWDRNNNGDSGRSSSSSPIFVQQEVMTEVKLIRQVTGEQYQSKPNLWDHVVSALRRLLDYTLCCVTCGCLRVPEDHLHGEVYESQLMEEERTAVQNLLKYLDSKDSKEPTINDERLRALCILTYSDNEELQRSAALCFAEISERMKSPVTEIVLEPLVVLLKSRDTQVQRTASLAVSNFALNGPAVNKATILKSGAIKPLIQLLQSENLEVQCNTCGCITTLAVDDQSKQEIISSGGVVPLLNLSKSEDTRVQRNATGAILNLTHLQSNRNELVTKGALPVLVDVLRSKDPDVQYYCAAALSNMAVNERHRAMMVAVGYNDVIRELKNLLSSAKEKVKCQACLALRNLASDTDNQILIVKIGCLPVLHHVIRHSRDETLTAAMACLRNLSIHKHNEMGIIQETFLSELKCVVRDPSNTQAQIHAAGTIRNLAAGELIQRMTASGCVEALLDVLLSNDSEDMVLVEVSAALAILADDDETRQMILTYHRGDAFGHLISMAAGNTASDICYNCAGVLGQLAIGDIPRDVLELNCVGLLFYLNKFVSSEDPSMIHIALWTLVQLLKSDVFVLEFRGSEQPKKVEEIYITSQNEAIRELAKTVLNTIAENV